jgi:tetratricopeptide (TPR) repeat protein
MKRLLHVKMNAVAVILVCCLCAPFPAAHAAEDTRSESEKLEYWVYENKFPTQVQFFWNNPSGTVYAPKENPELLNDNTTWRGVEKSYQQTIGAAYAKLFDKNQLVRKDLTPADLETVKNAVAQFCNDEYNKLHAVAIVRDLQERWTPELEKPVIPPLADPKLLSDQNIARLQELQKKAKVNINVDASSRNFIDYVNYAVDKRLLEKDRQRYLTMALSVAKQIPYLLDPKKDGWIDEVTGVVAKKTGDVPPVQPPETKPPETKPPVQPPAVNPPVQPPETKPPETKPPVQPPETKPPETKPPVQPPEAKPPEAKPPAADQIVGGGTGGEAVPAGKTAQDYFDEGKKYFDGTDGKPRDDAAALSNFVRAAETDPNFIEAYFMIGMTANRTGDWVLSVGALATAIDKTVQTQGPDKVPVDYYNALGMALDGAGDYKNAILSYMKALKIAPDKPDIKINLEPAIKKYREQGGTLDALADSEITFALLRAFAQTFGGGDAKKGGDTGQKPEPAQAVLPSAQPSGVNEPVEVVNAKKAIKGNRAANAVTEMVKLTSRSEGKTAANYALLGEALLMSYAGDKAIPAMEQAISFPEGKTAVNYALLGTAYLRLSLDGKGKTPENMKLAIKSFIEAARLSPGMGLFELTSGFTRGGSPHLKDIMKDTAAIDDFINKAVNNYLTNGGTIAEINDFLKTTGAEIGPDGGVISYGTGPVGGAAAGGGDGGYIGSGVKDDVGPIVVSGGIISGGGIDTSPAAGGGAGGQAVAVGGQQGGQDAGKILQTLRELHAKNNKNAALLRALKPGDPRAKVIGVLAAKNNAQIIALTAQWKALSGTTENPAIDIPAQPSAGKPAAVVPKVSEGAQVSTVLLTANPPMSVFAYSSGGSADTASAYGLKHSLSDPVMKQASELWDRLVKPAVSAINAKNYKNLPNVNTPPLTAGDLNALKDAYNAFANDPYIKNNLPKVAEDLKGKWVPLLQDPRPALIADPAKVESIETGKLEKLEKDLRDIYKATNKGTAYTTDANAVQYNVAGQNINKALEIIKKGNLTEKERESAATYISAAIIFAREMGVISTDDRWVAEFTTVLKGTDAPGETEDQEDDPQGEIGEVQNYLEKRKADRDRTQARIDELMEKEGPGPMTAEQKKFRERELQGQFNAAWKEYRYLNEVWQSTQAESDRVAMSEAQAEYEKIAREVEILQKGSSLTRAEEVELEDLRRSLAVAEADIAEMEAALDGVTAGKLGGDTGADLPDAGKPAVDPPGSGTVNPPAVNPPASGGAGDLSGGDGGYGSIGAGGGTEIPGAGGSAEIPVIGGGKDGSGEGAGISGGDTDVSNGGTGIPVVGGGTGGQVGPNGEIPLPDSGGGQEMPPVAPKPRQQFEGGVIELVNGKWQETYTDPQNAGRVTVRYYGDDGKPERQVTKITAGLMKTVSNTETVMNFKNGIPSDNAETVYYKDGHKTVNASQYDDKGQLAGSTWAEYDANGKIQVEMTGRYDDASAYQGGSKKEYVYDESGQLNSITETTYDKNNKVVGEPVGTLVQTKPPEAPSVGGNAAGQAGGSPADLYREQDGLTIAPRDEEPLPVLKPEIPPPPQEKRGPRGGVLEKQEDGTFRETSQWGGPNEKEGGKQETYYDAGMTITKEVWVMTRDTSIFEGDPRLLRMHPPKNTTTTEYSGGLPVKTTSVSEHKNGQTDVQTILFKGSRDNPYEIVESKTLTYDAKKNLIGEKVDTIGADGTMPGCVEKTYRYAYSADGQQKTVWTIEKTVVYDWNDYKNPERVTGTKITSETNYGDGRLRVETETQNEKGQTTAKTDIMKDTNGRVLEEKIYSYDAKGVSTGRVEKVYEYDTNGTLSKTTETTYDKDGRLSEKRVFTDNPPELKPPPPPVEPKIPVVTPPPKPGVGPLGGVLEKQEDGTFKETVQWGDNNKQEILYDTGMKPTKETFVWNFTQSDSSGMPNFWDIHPTKGTGVTEYVDGKPAKTTRTSEFKDGRTEINTTLFDVKGENSFKVLESKTLTYDSKKNLIAERTDTIDEKGSWVGYKEKTYTYSSTTGAVVKTDEKSYDVQGKVTGRMETEISRRAADGRVLQETIKSFNASGATTGRVENTYAYAADGRVSKETIYSYDAKGVSKGRVEKAYEYDSNGELTQTTENSYDKDGKTEGSVTTVPREDVPPVIAVAPAQKTIVPAAPPVEVYSDQGLTAAQPASADQTSKLAALIAARKEDVSYVAADNTSAFVPGVAKEAVTVTETVAVGVTAATGSDQAQKLAALIQKQREDKGEEITLETYAEGDAVDKESIGLPKKLYKMAGEGDDKNRVELSGIKYKKGTDGSMQKEAYAERHLDKDGKMLKSVQKANIAYKDGKEADWNEQVTVIDGKTGKMTQTLSIVADGKPIASSQLTKEANGKETYTGNKEIQAVHKNMRAGGRSVAGTGAQLQACREKLIQRTGAASMDAARENSRLQTQSAMDKKILEGQTHRALKQQQKALTGDVQTEGTLKGAPGKEKERNAP